MGIVELCHGRESSINILAGALYAGSLIPMTSLLVSESCLSNLQNSDTLSRASEWACFSLRAASLSRCKRNSHPQKGNPSRHDEPKPEVSDLDLEAAPQENGPDLQAEPGLEPEPDLTKAGHDLAPDLLSLENAPG